MVFEIESKDYFAGVKLIVTTLIDSQLFQRKFLSCLTSRSTLLIRFDPDFDSTKGHKGSGHDRHDGFQKLSKHDCRSRPRQPRREQQIT